MYTNIKTGFTCNNSCIHCVIAPIRDNLQDEKKALDSTTEEVKQFIDEAIDRGSDTVVLTGGEVTIRKDFSELVEYAAGKGLKIAIQTNGRLFARPSQRILFKGLPKVLVVIAIHGPDADIHDRITRKKNSFSQTITAIQALVPLENVNVCAKIVISKHNADCISETVQMLNQMRISEIVIAFPHAEDFPVAVFKEVVPRYESIKGEISKLLKAMDSAEIHVTFETIPYCIMPDNPEFWNRSLDAWYTLYGKENPGFMQRTGDRRVHNWENERKAIKQKGSGCGLCVFDKVCEGPWEEYVSYYGQDEFVPISDPSVVDKL